MTTIALGIGNTDNILNENARKSDFTSFLHNSPNRMDHRVKPGGDEGDVGAEDDEKKR